MTNPNQPLFSSPGYEPSTSTAAPGTAAPADYQRAAANAYPQIGLSGGPAPGRGPTMPTPEPRRYLLIAGAALAVIAVVLVAAVTLSGPDESGSTAASQTRPAGTEQQSESSGTDSGSERARPEPTGRKTPTQSVPPPLVQAPDSYDETCGNGFHVTGRSGWATNSGRGSNETSCSFARSVLLAYWDQNGPATMSPRTVVAAGKVACPTTGGRCAGNDFIMECAVLGSDPWITCTGGRNARVYIY